MAIDTPLVVGSLAIQGNNYPIYGTAARATEYFNASLSGSTYTGAPLSDQQRSLVTARRLIDRQNFLGTTTAVDQFTAFPRDEETLVPLKVEFAQYELALVLLESPDVFNQSSTGSNERRLRAGPVEIEFFSSTLSSNRIGGGAGIFPPQVLDLLRSFLASTASISIPFAGGINNPSNVIPREGNDISDGL